MTTCYYCTPEWLEESSKIYNSNSEFEDKLKKITYKLAYRVMAEPEWGIDDDIHFCVYLDKGKLTRIELISEDDAKNEADFLMAATPETWKGILKKEKKFVTDFMLGKISLEQGSKVDVLGIAPHADTLVDAITAVNLVFPDELSSGELEQYRENMLLFRKKLCI